MSTRAGPQRKRSDRTRKPSARYQRVLEDEAYAEQIQKTYSPSTVTNASMRALPLEVARQRDGHAFQMPSLANLCLEVVAKNFLTHILPSQQTYDEARGVSRRRSNEKDKTRQTAADRRPTATSKTLNASQFLGAVAKGIGKKRRLADEDEGFAPSDGSGSDREEIGIASAPSTWKRGKSERSSPPAAQVRISIEDLTELSQENHQLLKLLPEATSMKLLRLLKRYCPSALTRTILTTYFVNGRSQVELDASMTLLAERPEQVNLIVGAAGNSVPPTSSLTRLPSHPTPPLTSLNLSGLPKLSPQSLCALFRRSPVLYEVVLKGCVRVDAVCMQALVEGGSMNTLRILNANFTDIGLRGVELIVSNARSLTTLKIANVLGLKDQILPEMIRRAILHASEKSPPFPPLGNLRTLKVRGTEMGIFGLSSFIQLCKSTLDNLDIGSLNINTEEQVTLLAMSLGYGEATTNDSDVGEADAISIRAPLRKLNVSHNFQNTGLFHHTMNPMTPLVQWISQMAGTLQTLILDGLPLKLSMLSQGSSAFGLMQAFSQALEPGVVTAEGTSNIQRGLIRCSLSNTDLTVLTPNDFWLDADNEEAGSLLANTENINLSSIDLRTSEYIRRTRDLFEQPYKPQEDWVHPPVKRFWRVKRLDLSNTHIGDEELESFAERCGRLEAIDLSGTAVTAEGVYSLIRQCPFIVSVNLTGCRGVPIRQRRNIFDYV